MHTTENVAYKLEKLAQFYRQGQAVSQMMTKTLDKLFDNEAEECRNQIRQLREDLSRFENQYKMTSEIFFQRFQNGDTDDCLDFIEWASIFQMLHGLEKRLALLD